MPIAIIDTLKIYEDLKEKFDETQAKAIAEVIEKSFNNYREHEKEFLVTKGEFQESMMKLREAITTAEAKLTTTEARLREAITTIEAKLTTTEARLREAITITEAKLRTLIADTKSEIIRWMFIFWAGQIGVLCALFALFK